MHEYDTLEIFLLAECHFFPFLFPVIVLLASGQSGLAVNQPLIYSFKMLENIMIISTMNTVELLVFSSETRLTVGIFV